MKQLDFDRAFPQTPPCIHSAIEMGFRKGKKQMKMRNKIISMSSIAAAVAIMIAVASFASGGLDAPLKPDILAQPKVTDVPKASEEAFRVYSTEGADFYHLEPDCSGMENAIEMSEIEAVQMGKQPCPVCIPLVCNGHDGEEIAFVYYSQGAKYFHKQQECGGIFELKGEYSAVTRAFPAKEPCPICFPNGIEECVHGRAFAVEIQPTAAPAPEIYAEENESSTKSMPVPEEYAPMDTGRESENLHHDIITLPALYYTPAGIYYHSDEHCMGMMNARSHSREEARDSGKISCPYCLDVYCTEGGKYFHLLSYCSGMQNAGLRSIEEAREMGKIRCDICMNPAMVYATTNGAYCHVNAGCSGMRNAAVMPLDEALIDHEKRICPVCMHDYSDYPEAAMQVANGSE